VDSYSSDFVAKKMNIVQTGPGAGRACYILHLASPARVDDSDMPALGLRSAQIPSTQGLGVIVCAGVAGLPARIAIQPAVVRRHTRLVVGVVFKARASCKRANVLGIVDRIHRCRVCPQEF
jgi:hypothetical protein